MYHNHPLLTVAIGIVLMAQLAIAAVDPPVRPEAPRTLVASAGPPPANFLAMTPANDAIFVREMIAGGKQEIAGSRAALAQSQRVEVRAIAQTLTLDHSDLNLAFARLAKRKGWSVEPGTASSSSAPVAVIPADVEPFSDRRYIETQIAAHKASIETLRRQASHAREPEVRELAARSLWKLEQHLAQLQRLEP